MRDWNRPNPQCGSGHCNRDSKGWLDEMILTMNENGEFEEYKESYASVDFKTEEDYKRFEEILKYYNNREEHDRQIRAKAIDDLISKCESAKSYPARSQSDCGTNCGLSMAIRLAEELKPVQIIKNENLSAKNTELDVDWTKVPVDTPIYVSNDSKYQFKKRHFAKYDGYNIHVWADGKTSFTIKHQSSKEVYRYGRLAEIELEG